MRTILKKEKHDKHWYWVVRPEYDRSLIVEKARVEQFGFKKQADARAYYNEHGWFKNVTYPKGMQVQSGKSWNFIEYTDFTSKPLKPRFGKYQSVSMLDGVYARSKSYDFFDSVHHAHEDSFRKLIERLFDYTMTADDVPEDELDSYYDEVRQGIVYYRKKKGNNIEA